MNAFEVFLAALAAQLVVKIMEIAGRWLSEWFFTASDGCPERPVVVAPVVSDCSLCKKPQGQPGGFHGCTFSGKPCAPAGSRTYKALPPGDPGYVPSIDG